VVGFQAFIEPLLALIGTFAWKTMIRKFSLVCDQVIMKLWPSLCNPTVSPCWDSSASVLDRSYRKKLSPKMCSKKPAWRPLPRRARWKRERGIHFPGCTRFANEKIIDAHRRYFTTQKRAAAREAALPAEDQTGGGLANLLVASMTTPSRAFSRDQNQLQMLAALDSLPNEQREALRLRYLIGLPSKEVAKKMGKSDGAVRVMLTRSLTRLNEMLTG
jgi:RNA polymerase sigma factor (sigma-70 family)